MNLYQKYLLPKLINWSCKQEPAYCQRKRIIPGARGRVLEIGIGSGLNLPFYNGQDVTHLTGIDPSREMWALNRIDTDDLPFEVSFIRASAENIPAGNHSYDSVVTTYTLCTIPDTIRALAEIRRILKPTGRLIFCEHGLAPDPRVRRWQNRFNPIWKLIGGGCNLNRDIRAIITGNGFHIASLKNYYIPGWKPASFNYLGTAIVR